jgi:signal transduction histidine kinase/ActR/RegA family two-component response regulator
LRKRQVWIAVVFAAITLALWLSVGLNDRFRQDKDLANFNAQQMALVKSIAAASQGWMELRLQESANTTQAAQEVVQRFIEPVQLLQDSSFWVYERGQLVYHQAPDFPAEYQGKSAAAIFDLQKQKGASHFDELVAGITNSTQGSGWYVWLPATGRQYAAWFSTSIAGAAWTFGISTPETEILLFSASQQALQREIFGASLITLLLWGGFFLALRQMRLSDSQHEVLAQSGSDQNLPAPRPNSQAEELAQANIDLQKAASARDEFLSTIGHELRTPLSNVIGLTYALQCQVYGPVTEKQAASLETILSTTRHLSSMVNDILDFSGIQAGTMKLEKRPVSMPSFLDACMAFIDQQAFRKSIKVSFDRDPQVNWIEGDESRLKQLVFNLLNNAVKFTPAGGQVGVEVKGNPPDQQVELTVWDRGIGIAAADFPRLFTPFSQLDAGITRQYGGTGLGLSLVLRIAELHDGSISVTSEVGKGSRFTLALPWREDETQDLAEESAQIIHTLEGIERPERATRILIVDGEAQTSQLVADFLTAAGYEVSLASGGKAAKSLFKDLKPHLVVANLRLPDMDGLELIRNLRADANLGSVPIVAINTLEFPGDGAAALQAGASAYIKKPLHLEKLAELALALLNEPGKADPT